MASALRACVSSSCIVSESTGRLCAACAVLMTCLLVLSPTAAARHAQSEQWFGNFDTGDLSQWTGVQRAAPDRIRLVTDPRRDGGFAARFEVRAGDYPAGRTGERAELFSVTPDHPGTEWYYAWSTLFPDDFLADGNWKHMFVQWHGPGSSAASVSFQVSHDRLVVRVGSPYTPTKWAQYDLGPLVRGAWQDFIFHVRWAADASGFVEVWRNGIRVVKKRYHVNAAAEGPNYLKIGYYRDPSPTPAVLYADAVRLASTLREVVRPLRLRFTRAPILRDGALELAARSFANARIAVGLRTGGSRREVRLGVFSTDGSGRLQVHLRLPERPQGRLYLHLRALVDPSLGPAARDLTGRIQRS